MREKENTLWVVGVRNEVLIMNEKKIQLQNVEDVKEFVSAAEKCEFDIDVKYNHIIVDAKSFLSILALVRTTLCVTSRGYDSAFEKTVDKYAVC